MHSECTVKIVNNLLRLIEAGDERTRFWTKKDSIETRRAKVALMYELKMRQRKEGNIVAIEHVHSHVLDKEPIEEGSAEDKKLSALTVRMNGDKEAARRVLRGNKEADRLATDRQPRRWESCPVQIRCTHLLIWQ